MSNETQSAPAVGIVSYMDSDGWHTVVLEGAATSIGRSPQRDVVLDDPKVSRLHAVILRDERSYSLVDQNSTRGTYLNGEAVKRALLKHGDVLQFGSVNGTKVRFFEKAEAHGGEESTSLRELLASRREETVGSNAAGEMAQLNWLLRAARQLNQGGAVEEILWALLQLTLQLTGIERGFVFLCEETSLRFVMGLDAGGKQLENDPGLSRRVIDQTIASNSKFFVSDTMADVMAREWSSLHVNEIRSIFCIPLRTPARVDAPSRLLGLVYLDSHQTAATLNARSTI